MIENTMMRKLLFCMVVLVAMVCNAQPKTAGQVKVTGGVIQGVHATERMLGAEKDMKESAEAKAFRELLLKYNIES